MESADNESKQVYSLNETPWYFGAYLNMARHNIFLLINHLTEKFSYLEFTKINDDKDISNKDNLLTKLFDRNEKKYEDDRFKVFKYLVKRHYLPLIRIFHEKNGFQLDTNPIVDYDGLHVFLNTAFSALNDFRNSYTHYLAIDSNGNRIKSRKQDVDEKMKNILYSLFRLSPDFSLKRFESTQESDDYDHLNTYEIFENSSSKLTEQGVYFFINLFLERAYAIKFLKKLRGFKNETTPKFRATLQAFTAYSLKVPDVRLDNDDRAMALLLEMLNELQRCPKELYNCLSEEDKKMFEPKIEGEQKSNILLNSIDYDTIKDEDIDDLLSEITALKRKSNRFPYFALRYIDETDLLPNIRFQISVGKLQTDNYVKQITNLMINRRIVRNINVFGKLSDFENKETEILGELKNGVENTENVYFEQYSPQYNIKNNKIPFYLFEDSVSPKIKYPQPLIRNKEEQIQNKPTGFISINDLPKFLLLSLLNSHKSEEVLKHFIHNNQEIVLNQEQLENIKNQLTLIPEEFTKRIAKEKSLKDGNGIIAFLNNQIKSELLNKHKLSEEQFLNLSGDEIKRIFKRNKKENEHADQIRYLNFIEQRKKELQKHLPETVLVNQLPSKTIDYLLNMSEPSDSKIIHVKIKAIKDDCKIKIKRLNKELEKDEADQNLNLGALATFLARDIIDMVIEEDVKMKITSPYFTKLQNKIAYFSISKTDVIEICDELNLFDNNIGHVFLNETLINSAKGVKEFYKNYLTSKMKWIDANLLKRGKTRGYFIPTNKKIPLTLSKVSAKIENKDFNLWLENKSRMSIDLPGTLFDNAIEKELSIQLHKNRIKFSDGDKFSIRLSKLLNDDTQPFYKFKRVYNLKDETVEFDLNDQDSKTLQSKYGKHVALNEKRIRFCQTQDRILKLLCEKLLLDKDYNMSKNAFALKSIFPFVDENPLNSPFQFKQRIVRKGNEDHFRVIAQDNELQIKEIDIYKNLKTVEEKENYKGQKGYQWTIKDFGRFKRMVNDRRIPNLSLFFEDKEVTINLLEYQLREYDKYREKVFEATFNLEKEICSIAYEEIKNIELKNRGENGFNEVQFTLYTNWINEKGILEKMEVEKMIKIRNRFSHSEFPDKIEEIGKITKTENAKFEVECRKQGGVEKLNLSLSKKLFETYETLTSKVIRK